MATQTRKIEGSVLQGGRFYVAGDEAAFAEAMRGRSLAHLIERNVISGDWSDAVPEDASPVEAAADVVQLPAEVAPVEAEPAPVPAEAPAPKPKPKRTPKPKLAPKPTPKPKRSTTKHTPRRK